MTGNLSGTSESGAAAPMNENTQKAIEELLHGEDADRRRQAAEELGGHDDVAAIRALATALKDQDKGVRDATSQALLAIGGDPVARMIVDYIADDNIVTRNLAGDMLRRLGNDSVASLLPYTRNADCDVRKFAIDLLGLVGSAETAPSIISCLVDPDENVVVAAVETLGELRNPAVVPHLIMTYADHLFARASVAEAAGKIGGPEALGFLQQTFDEVIAATPPDLIVLCTLIDSLGSIGDERSLATLQGKVPFARGKVRHLLLDAIVRISERVSGSVSLDQRFVRDLLDMLNDDNAGMKSSAVKGLAASPGREVTRALLQCFAVTEELDNLLHCVLVERDDTLSVAVESLMGQDAAGHKHTIRLIGHLADRLIQQTFSHHSCEIDESLLTRAFEEIQSLWGGSDHETRGAIVEALFKLDGDRTISFFETLMEDPDPWLRIAVIEFVTAVADRRVPMFVNRYLDDEDPMVCEAAMSILASCGEAPS
jgi:hypothetical protein